MITGFVDSNYAANLDKRRSLTGYIFTFLNNVVSWRFILQSVVALSSTKVEYIALKEVVWLKGESTSEMLDGICDVKIHCDSQNALALSRNPTFHDRTKHIDVKFHFVREIVQEEGVKLVKINTTHNPANMMLVNKTIYVSCLNLIMGKFATAI